MWSGIPRLSQLWCFALGALLLSPFSLKAHAGDNGPRLFSAREVRTFCTNSTRLIIPSRLEGVVLWVSPRKDRLYLQEDENLILVEMDLEPFKISVSDRIRIEGEALVRDRAGRYTFARLPVVDNDGIHPATERSGQIYLTKGLRRIEVGYFNRQREYSLKAEFQGPETPRQIIPSSALFHEEISDGQPRWAPGLAYRYFEDHWNRLPDFNSLHPVQTGVVPHFEVRPGPRIELYGVQFTGAMQIEHEGLYTFFTTSDDGSCFQFELSEPSLEVIGTGQVPVAKRIDLAKSLADEASATWATVQAEVFYAGLGTEGWELELRSSLGRMRVLLPSMARQIPEFLLRSRIRATGIVQGVRTADGGRVAGELLLPDLNHIGLMSVPAELWNNLPLRQIAEIPSLPPDVEFVRLRGKVESILPSGGSVLITDGQSSISVETISRPSEKSRGPFEIIGRLKRSNSALWLQWGVFRELDQSKTDQAAPLPILTTIEQVHQLKKEDAALHYPVRVQAVVTWATPGDVDATVQDSTRGIYVQDLAPSPSDTPRVGDYVQIFGETDAGDFAPVIVAAQVRVIDRGRIPEMARPHWDQLVNGSLDSQLVELSGTVTAARGHELTLVVPGGSIRVDIQELQPDQLREYENAQVRIRGVLIASWDGRTRQVLPGAINMRAHSIQLDRPAPSDLFDLPSKSLAELLRFDPKATAAQRVKITGQVVYLSDSHIRLADPEAGVKVVCKEPVALALGEKVEVVGFTRLTEGSAVLLEANVRKNGKASLLAPIILTDTNLFQPNLDSRLVQFDGTLVDHRREGEVDLFEVRLGSHVIKAALHSPDLKFPRLAPRSELRLTGVYALVDRPMLNRGGPREFEILLNRPADVVVLRSPPWWTSERSLTAFGVLAFILAGSLAWIHTLRRHVVTRTRQLQREVEERKQAEAAARKAREEAELADRAKSQFLANMSHEIRTPMNGVLGMTGLLMQTPLTPEQRDYAQTVRESSEALLTLINDILDFSKVEAGKVQLNSAPFDLREIIDGALEVLAPQAHARNLELACVFDSQIPAPLSGDAGRLRQILLNLVGNAIKFTRQGEIVVAVSALRRNETDLHIRIKVRDTGIGIAPAILPRLFQPFVQADGSTTRQFGGTGLGLAIVRRLVDAMGGEINVESEPGRGSTFTITLALQPEPAARPASLALSEPARLQRILLLENNADALQAFRENLLCCGLRLDANTSSPEGALSLLSEAFSAGKPFHTFFVAKQMLGPSSREFFESIRRDKRFSNLRIITLTTHSDRAKGPEWREFGTDESLAKPVQLGRLHRILNQQSARNTAASLAPSVPCEHQLRILIAEDNPVNQKVALKQLQKLGYRAETAENGLEVLNRLETAEFDLILMDCDMPGLDGYEATRRIRKRKNNRHIQIVAMTANAMEGDREKCLAVGMDNYIAKPTRLSDLQSILESAAATAAAS